METGIKNRNKNNLLLLLVVIAASLLVIWVITLFDKMDNPGTEKSNNRFIKQTITNSTGYDLYSLLRLEKNYT